MRNFSTRSYDGSPRKTFSVRSVGLPAPTATPMPAHHILVVDRSGSMYSEMGAVRTMIEKLLTLQEYKDASVRVSLLSYSSKGDMTAHFERISVQETMQPESNYIKSVRNLRPTGLTCMSQAMAYAATLRREGEVTCVTLHSDGYANDRSPSEEKREMDGILKTFASQGGTFVNTVCYGGWADFPFLSHIANACGGKAFQAPTAREFFDALAETQAQLAGTVFPAVVVPVQDAAYQIYVSPSRGILYGGTGDLTIRNPDPQGAVYQYIPTGVPQGEECPAGAPEILAYARARLSEQALAEAKFAVIASRDRGLLSHLKALVGPDLAAFAAALDARLFNGQAVDAMSSYGIPNANQPSVLAILNTLGQHTGNVGIHLPTLQANYVRRGVPRVAGVRDEQGVLVPPEYDTEYVGSPTWANLNAVELNRTTATVNMRISRPLQLVNRATREVVSEVAGIPLEGKLFAYNNYTVVGDGSLNLPRIQVRFYNKRAFQAVASLIPELGSYSAETEYTIDFEGRPLVPYTLEFDPSIVAGFFEEAVGLKMVESILTAVVKDDSEDFTPDQIAALKLHGLSSRLNVNFPTTTPYTDLQEELSAGRIDSRISTEVHVGSRSLLALSDLHSANKFLDRMFTQSLKTGEAVAKPNFSIWWDCNYGAKVLSARTKLTAVDHLMKPVYEEFLGVASTGALAKILSFLSPDDWMNFQVAIARKCTREDAVSTFQGVLKQVSRRLDDMFAERLSPMVFFIGATGIVPDTLATTGLTAEQLQAACPEIKLGKAEADGTFYLVGDAVLSVYQSVAYVARTSYASDEAA